ncbi:MAG: DivIVA domain-containing protein [Oscillospiraceae bacterium]|nr:DivIVA domain-containing protein [Oscillospiraceae bacterium]
MNAKEISSRKFDRGFNGYKPDEVDEFLREISTEFSQLQSDNRDLEKKLEVLADKVREYRDDEDAIKEAMLGAQKQGNATIAEAKERAKKIVEDAQNKSDTMLAEARDESTRLREEADLNLKNANDEAKRIENEAAAKLARMEEEYKNRLDTNKEILSRTKTEVVRFRQKLLEDFERVTGIMEAIPESCENEFIAKTLTDYQKEKNVTLKKPAVKPVPAAQAQETPKQAPPPALKAPEPEKAEGDTLFEEFAAKMLEDKKSTSFEMKMEDGFLADLTTDIGFEPVFDEEEEADETTEINSEVFPSDEDAAEADATPFYKKTQGTVKEREVLEFGSNAKNAKKK